MRIMKDAEDNGVEACTGMYNTLLSVCARSSDGPGLTRSVVETMIERGIVRDEITYLAVLEAVQR